jgi:uncharacterized protein YrrD
VDDLGGPIAYLALTAGTPVYDRDGRRIGVVEHVLADTDLDIFHGVIVHTHPLPGRHLYADADQIAQLYERGVALSVRAEDLHDPGQQSATHSGVPAETESPLQARLRKAWDWIIQHL